jgi:hypothetical protein
MATRDILPLSVLILKAIAKKPSQYLTEASLSRYRRFRLSDYDLAQDLIKAITEAGRLTDDAFPLELIDPSRTSLVANNTKLSGKYFRDVFDRCMHLTAIDLSGSFQVDDETTKYMFQRCLSLRHLRIRNCRKLTAKTLEDLLSSPICLKELDIGGDVNIEVKGVDDFINKYSYIEQIETLHLSGLIIRDSTVSAIIKKCKSVTKLGIAYADISDQSLSRLIQSLGAHLLALNIAWLSTTSAPIHNQIESDKLLSVLINSCPVLEELDVSGIKSITSVDINYLVESINQRAAAEGLARHPLKIIRVKFVASNKMMMEQALVSTFPSIKFDC